MSYLTGSFYQNLMDRVDSIETFEGGLTLLGAPMAANGSVVRLMIAGAS